MKIGFDAKRAFNNAAGLGNFSRNTITALARQNPDDQYFLFHPGIKNPLFLPPENSVEIKPEGLFWKTFKNSWRSFRIANQAKNLNIDLYHGLSHELPLGIEKTGIKSVVTIHDLIYFRFPEYFKAIDRTIYDRKFRHACRVAHRIHAISEQTKRDLISFFAVPEEKIKVIYQSVNPLFFLENTWDQKLAIRRKYQLPEKFLLTVGTVEPRKNLLALLEGMVLAKLYIPVVVIGKLTCYHLKVQKFIEADLNRLEVFFLPKIKVDELAVLYQMAEVMVYPSLFEGFGLPVAEAQASGCPVITSNTSSLPEAGGSAALYINPENPEEIGRTIKNLLADHNLRDSLIEKGKINAQRFTGESFAQQLKQLYNSVVNV
ncbi:MAG: glycosyltransferase family 1 protein [Bacteroidota bacterium]|nr:glycosyltransferase family 1 protein [Odoribacter sp.]MDP3642633.1 glycosyltransferase family 1 protein [Bacteroidota bacterium]